MRYNNEGDKGCVVFIVIFLVAIAIATAINESVFGYLGSDELSTLQFISFITIATIVILVYLCVTFKSENDSLNQKLTYKTTKKQTTGVKVTCFFVP